VKARLPRVVGAALLLALVALGAATLVVACRPYVLKGPEEPIYALAFSPRGDLLASASGDGTVRVWSVPSGPCVATLEHGSSGRSVAFSPDGAHLATGGTRGPVRLWSTSTWKPERELESPNSSGRLWASIAFSHDGEQVLALDGEAYLHFWKTRDGSFVKRFEARSHDLSPHAFVLGRVACSPVSDTVAVAAGSNVMMGSSGAWSWTVNTGQRSPRAIAFSGDGRTLVFPTHEKYVGILDVAHLTPKATKIGPFDTIVTTLSTARASDLLLVGAYGQGGSGGVLALYSLHDGAELKRFPVPDRLPCAAISPEGEYVAAVARSKDIWIWRARAPHPIAALGD
jgi:WD40 repeat protein